MGVLVEEAGGSAEPAQGGEAHPAESGEAHPTQGGEAHPAQGGEAHPAQGGEAHPAQGGEVSPAEGSEAPPAQGGEAHPAEGDEAHPGFLCDAMLGGLSRWLRGVGYDAVFEHGIDDGELVRRAQQTGRLLLSSDAGVFARRLLRTEAVRGLYVPRGLRPREQAGFVLRELKLSVRDPRCMACGGALEAVSKDVVLATVPARVAEHHDAFWRCERCGKVLWKGSHWRGITAGVAAAVRAASEVAAVHAAADVAAVHAAPETATSDVAAAESAPAPAEAPGSDASPLGPSPPRG